MAEIPPPPELRQWSEEERGGTLPCFSTLSFTSEVFQLTWRGYWWFLSWEPWGSHDAEEIHAEMGVGNSAWDAPSRCPSSGPAPHSCVPTAGQPAQLLESMELEKLLLVPCLQLLLPTFHASPWQWCKHPSSAGSHNIAAWQHGMWPWCWWAPCSSNTRGFSFPMVPRSFMLNWPGRIIFLED